jgi:hypothetical protein
MEMRKLYVYKTSAGAFYIAEHGGRFHPLSMVKVLAVMQPPNKPLKIWQAGTRFLYHPALTLQRSVSRKTYLVGNASIEPSVSQPVNTDAASCL